MKRITRKFFALICCIGLFIVCGTRVVAATYTAILSGNFSSTATWGGSVPPSILITDNIVIPAGISVTLDQNQTISGSLAIFTVNGSLTSATGTSLIITSGNVMGNGTLTIDSLVMGITTGFNFTGSIAAKHFTSLGTTISSSAGITVQNRLHLTNNILSMASGSLTLSTNAMVEMAGGTMVASGGTVDLTNIYHVMYNSTSANTGLELTGSGLGKIYVNVPSSSSVTLTADLNVKDTLTLTSGILDLNNRNLTFTGNGNFSMAGTGTISGASGSNISIMSNNNFAGGIRFTSTANTINNLTINTSNNSSAGIATNLTVNGILNLNSGTLHIWSNSLIVASSGSVTGGSSSSYVITGTNGSLALSLNAGGSNTYHIGTATHYAPATIMANSGSANSVLSVGVNNQVLAQGTTGTALSNTQPLVNATWYAVSSVSTGLNLNMQLMWSTNMEVNSFNRGMAYISHYTSAGWDVMADASATTLGNGMHVLSRNNITTLSPFAVMDKNASTNLKTLTTTPQITIYPNPIRNTLHFNGKNIQRVDIYDATGRKMASSNISAENAINIEQLSPGIYYAHFFGVDFNKVQKFVKQ